MLKENLMKLFDSEDYKGMTKEELAKYLDIDIPQYRDFFKALIAMEKDNLIYLSQKGKYLPMSFNKDCLTGKIKMTNGNFAFFIPDNKEEDDVYINDTKLMGAMDGDQVMIKLTKEKSKDYKAEGQVIKILSDELPELVGTLIGRPGSFYLRPDGSKYKEDIFIDDNNLNGAKVDDKLVGQIIKRPSKTMYAEALIKEIIGSKFDDGIEITSIARQFALPFEFSKETLIEASKLGHFVKEEELKGRKDFTNLFTVTIDGKDAKDFDDAISIEKIGDIYRLFVHIADVCNYVKPGSNMDKEAYLRGNSVYMLDRVIPMLPTDLSDELCSLKEGQIRLTHTVSMDIDSFGKIKDYSFYVSYIKSNYRLVYDDVSDFLEGKNDPYKDDKLKESLKLFEEVFKILEEKRKNSGAIDFNFAETEFVLDDKANVLDIKKMDRRVANRIIEEFMIVCNETVAKYFAYMNYPFIYRVHEEPSMEKLKELNLLLANLGYKFKGKTIYSMDYQNLLDEVKGKSEELLIATMLLRSLRKALYSKDLEIHFGLASNNYCHFTAPIRRYADLAIHRIFKKACLNILDMKNIGRLENILSDIAEQASARERVAEEAEREVEKLLKIKYMRKHIGDLFPAIVTSVTSFGVFMQLENTIEGLAAYRDMKDDYYFFDEESYTAYGEKSGNRIKLGDKLQVKLIGINDLRREINFEIMR